MLATSEINISQAKKAPDVHVKILADGKVLKVQKTRQRRILSCIHCHSKKIKCSRAVPTCDHCQKLGIDCQYFVNERISKGGKRKKKSRSSFQNGSAASNSTSDTSSISREDSKILKQESSEMEMEMENSSKSSTNDHPQSQEMTIQDNKLMETLSSNFPNLPKSLLQTPVMNSMSNNMTNSYFSNTNGSTNANADHEKEDQYSFNLSSFTYASYQGSHPHTQSYNKLVNQDLHSSLSSHNNSSTNISSLFAKNPSHIYPQNSIMDHSKSHLHQNTQGPQTFRNPASPHYPNSASFEISERLDNTKNFLNGTNTYYDNENLLEDLENHLPTSKPKSYELVERYLNSVHILLPIITNIDDFVREHDKYWKECNPYEKETNNSLTDLNLLQFYTLYFPILYAATISEFEEYDNLLLNQDINKYLKGFNKICQYYNYPHGLKIIPLLLGNVIIQSTSPNPSTMEMSSIIRYAKFLQMNKDPVFSLNIKNYEIIKFRRLLWWTIFGLDCLTSHNFCLPPVCKFDDFNVVLPSDEEPIFNQANEIVGYTLNTSVLSLNIKFKYDRILNELVSQLHSDNSKNLSKEKMNEIKKMICEYFDYIHLSINKMNLYHKKFPPKTVGEVNLLNFIKNHSWSFVDRAVMLLHKKFLLNEHDSTVNKEPGSSSNSNASYTYSIDSYDVHLTKPRNGILSFNSFEDTFQSLVEENLIKNFVNFQNLNLGLDFNQFNNFSYNDINNNLIPSILHNLNDFLKYNDFLKFGKFNWYVKRTIPLDSIILLFIIIIVKFKFETIKFNELIIYVKLINKSLFILNRKWFKNEKYKRMLSLTNLTWEYILKKFKILHIINKFTSSNFSITSSNKNKIFNKYEYFNYQLTGYLNTTELFKTMQVAQPNLSMELINKLNNQKIKYISNTGTAAPDSPGINLNINSLVSKYDTDINLIESNDDFKIEKDFTINSSLTGTFHIDEDELVLLHDKICFDLKNNYVDINDYCAFYISLENILHQVINFVD
ncbi:hypothetical protein CANTEDRAFT_118534 [Yamadazyma tenuis ATCC 10573]|uniref:Zn(2)-C6 fungal-type domain-containing protein n=1 Tax=Candida tenuis (strain ATCC 10573 / BCRC 21748 / CBS 615 / JCM 9827 / NBRC 10315 / NRRL Y-1498 / VKM Y-70) TaxID=590646 RepID=G3AYA9_CANTC|nr:uncharacterized protein CANTEDRAFT_118534 [Yamadazyma tenuis ATCC 10573]EGV65807.1 hypothetical protein CANTEDRAFT_118534 [Yamadazyma tenuis ATCC 10573]